MNKPPHTWCNVHEPDRLPEQADENADVFAAVSAIEEDRIQTSNRNLKGKFLMNTTVTNDQLETKIEAAVHSRNTYGDPVTILGKHLPDVSRDYYARVLNSMHWYMQMAVINSARAILFDLYSDDEIKSDETPGEHFANFCLDIHDVLKRESIWTENETCVAAVEKHALMLKWEQKAISAANANDRDYEPKSLTDLLLEEKPAKVRVETRANFEVLAERQAKKLSTDPAVIELKKAEFMKRLVTREDMLAKDRVDGNKKLIPVIEVILEHIEKNTPRSVVFTSMDKKFMRSIISFAQATLERIAETDMAKDRKVTTQAYMRILDCQDSCIAELVKFRDDHANEAEELEYAGTPQTEAHDRAQKAAAAARS